MGRRQDDLRSVTFTSPDLKAAEKSDRPYDGGPPKEAAVEPPQVEGEWAEQYDDLVRRQREADAK